VGEAGEDTSLGRNRWAQEEIGWRLFQPHFCHSPRDDEGDPHEVFGNAARKDGTIRLGVHIICVQRGGHVYGDHHVSAEQPRQFGGEVVQDSPVHKLAAVELDRRKYAGEGTCRHYSIEDVTLLEGVLRAASQVHSLHSQGILKFVESEVLVHKIGEVFTDVFGAFLRLNSALNILSRLACAVPYVKHFRPCGRDHARPDGVYNEGQDSSGLED